MASGPAYPDATMIATVCSTMPTVDATQMQTELNLLSSTQPGGLNAEEAALLVLINARL